MIEIRHIAAAVEREVARRSRPCAGVVGGLLGRRYGRGAWPWPAGVVALVRWAGEFDPLPRLFPGAGQRGVDLVGLAAPDATSVSEWSGTVQAANTVYWYATVRFGPGGACGGIDPARVWARANDGSGNDVGLMPATPGGVSAKIVPGLQPLVTWTYNPTMQAARPAAFQIFRATVSGAFDFGTVHATVAYTPGLFRHEWMGGYSVLSGQSYAYTVRAVTDGGVRSLTPRAGASPAPLYDDTSTLRAAIAVSPANVPIGIAEHVIEEAAR